MEEKTSNKASDKASKEIPPRRPAWNVWQGLFLLLIIYALEFFFGWLRTPQELDQLEGFFRYLTVGMGEALLYLVILLGFFRLIKRPLRELGLVRPLFRYILLGLLMGVFLLVAVGLLGNFLANLLGTPAPQSFTLVLVGAQYDWQLILLILLGGVIAPIKEEVFFRGLFYPPFRQEYGRGKGILFTAGLFALLHFDVVRFLPLLVGGVVLTWLYEKSGSLWPSIIAHGTWNTLMALMVWIQR
ncbi:putative metal-dependent membrane protease [Desulfitobacterium dichloroeliminans LMG P-21439]|uniref:Putative metal-dependent membrane protease n=1 Tax=Desulfitobacterium dichloroeliminans (strain LMG P-21439 / DCA1) TaxID=871963 RepID=L0F6G4_DESDL|nr:type II CAAX endopeptidase family protein [Desulfitobacterium dichloroeliminans]AGA68782.1 putative metal-dependent membrane protease [Desulfitobacterium dichloroeliminans LMG P-21439]